MMISYDNDLQTPYVIAVGALRNLLSWWRWS